MRHEVLNDLLNADQLLSVLVKNGISITELERNYNDVHNVHCIEDDDYEKVNEKLKSKILNGDLKSTFTEKMAAVHFPSNCGPKS